MEDLLHKLRNKSLESFLLRIFGTVALFSMHVILGRKLSPDNYGLYSFVMSFVTVLVLVATMGWTTVLLKLVPQYTIKQQWPFLKGLLLRSHQISLGLSIVLSMLLFYISTHIPDSHTSIAFYYAAWLLPIRSLIRLRQGLFQGLYDVKGSIIPDEILLPVLMVAGLLIFKLPLVGGVILLYLLIACAVFVFTLVWLRHLLPSELKKVSPEFELNVWNRLSIPFMLAGLSQVILGQSGVFLLGMFGFMTDAGLFSASFRLALFITFAMTAINVIGMPMMSASFNNNDISSVNILNNKSRRWSFFGACPVFLVLILFPNMILSIFGDGFEEAAVLLKILALGQLVNAAVGLAGSLLAVAGEERYHMKSMMASMLLCVVLMLMTIPVWGATGAAYSYSGSLIFLSILQLYKANRLLSV
jgi:O-antigen/teichoic acid export membrane protein